MAIFHHRNVEVVEYYTRLEDLNVSWDDKLCKLIHKSCHQMNNHNDIKIPYDTKYNYLV